MTAAFPRRDPHGRIARPGDLLGLVAAGLVAGFVIMAVLDLVLSLLGLGEFGRASGWLALVLPGWLFVEEFRAWPNGPARVAAALVGAAVAVTAGLLAAGLASAAPPLLSGAVGAVACAVLYALIWFHGVRWLAHRTGGEA
jgi:hypothetical protein